jgi:hypothetical protein
VIMRSCVEPLFANPCHRVAVVTHDPDMILTVGSHQKTADAFFQRPPASRLLSAVDSFR